MILSRSPSLARRAGPGTRPLNVHAGKRTPGAISISRSMAVTSNVRRVRPSGSRRDRRARPLSCCHAPCRTSVLRRDRPTSQTCRVQPSGQVLFATVPCRRQRLRHRRRWDFPNWAPKSWREMLDKANNLPAGFTCQPRSCETVTTMHDDPHEVLHAASDDRSPDLRAEAFQGVPPTCARRHFRACAQRGETSWQKITWS